MLYAISKQLRVFILPASVQVTLDRANVLSGSRPVPRPSEPHAFIKQIGGSKSSRVRDPTSDIYLILLLCSIWFQARMVLCGRLVALLVLLSVCGPVLGFVHPGPAGRLPKRIHGPIHQGSARPRQGVAPVCLVPESVEAG